MCRSAASRWWRCSPPYDISDMTQLRWLPAVSAMLMAHLGGLSGQLPRKEKAVLAARSLQTCRRFRSGDRAIARSRHDQVPAALPAGVKRSTNPTPLRLGCAPRVWVISPASKPAALRFTFAAAVQGTWLEARNSRSPPLPLRARLPGLLRRFIAPASRIGLPLPLLAIGQWRSIIKRRELRICSVDIQRLSPLSARLSLQGFHLPSSRDPMALPLSDPHSPQLDGRPTKHQADHNRERFGFAWASCSALNVMSSPAPGKPPCWRPRSPLWPPRLADAGAGRRT